jgi:hypothetical protein
LRTGLLSSRQVDVRGDLAGNWLRMSTDSRQQLIQAYGK